MIIPNSKVIPQCPEMILNEMEKKISTRTTQAKRVFYRDSKSVFLKILAVRAWNPPARQYSRYGLNKADMALLPSW